ncbi:MAG: SulP family inorganic anion transporter [Pseudomonadota bacterium]
MIAFLEAKRAGLFSGKHIVNNLVAGLVVGIVALPLAMAFAIASGAKPEQGIYTAIIAGFLVSVFGGSRLQIAGPTGAFIVILSGITAKYGIDGLQVATLMAGVMLVFLGVTRLGNVIKFIPAPVIVGFTAGIGVIIFTGQWKDFFGLKGVSGEHFHEKILSLFQALPGLHLATTGIALMSLALIILTPRVVKRVPGPLVAMVVATTLQAVFKFDGVATIGSTFGGIPQTLPSFHLPVVTMSRFIELIGPAFSVAMLGAIESLLSAVVADGMAGTKHNSNQELIGQGIANIVCPIFGGFAATGAIARTATNIRNGGTSPLAGITHSAVLILIVLFLAPLAAYIPLCALAAILFIVAYNMSEIHRFVGMVKGAPRGDVIVLVTTFLLTVFVDLVVAVNVGVILATLMFMQKMSKEVRVNHHSHDHLDKELGANGALKLAPGVLVYSIEGPFFFGGVQTLEKTLALINEVPKVLILRLDFVPFVDISGIQGLEEAIKDLKRRDVRVILCGANQRVYDKLARAGIIRRIGEENVFPHLKDALGGVAARAA